jgi:hypothetical protein
MRVDHLDQRNDHQRNEDERGKGGERGEDAGHGRTILRAATKPAGAGGSTPSASAIAMSASAAQVMRTAQSLDAACTMATTSSG